MSNSLVTEIISVLNNDSSIDDKRNELLKIVKHRRGNNRKFLYIIHDILYFHLPLSLDNKFKLCDRNFLEEEYKGLNKVLEKSSCTYFNAICSEILWSYTHDKSIAVKSINSYMQELKNPSLINDYIHTQLIISICRIYSKSKITDFDFEEFFQYSLKHVVSNYDSKEYSILFILKGLTACRENVCELEKTFEDAISHYETQQDYDKANDFLKGLENFYKTNKRKNELPQLWIRIAKNKEKRAEQYDWSNPQHAHMIILCIQGAMKYWGKVNDENAKKERQRLSKRIVPVKKLSLQNLKVFSSEPVDISQYVKTLKKYVDKATLESYIYNLAYVIPLISCEETLEELQKSDFISSAIFSSIKLDGEGRKKCIVPSLIGASDEERISVAEYHASDKYRLHADIIFRNFVGFGNNKFEFTCDMLSFLVDDNIIVSPEQKESFLKGIVAGFKLDLITAMHLLMPQVERCIRNLAKYCGAVIFKTYPNGVEECISMKSILNLPEVKECLDETFLFNLRLFLESEYGFGMRNEICHGLLSDNEIQSINGLAVWWFVLRMCCMFSPSLHRRLGEQSNSKS